MKKKITKALSVALAVTLLGGTLAGCGQKKDEKSNTPASTASVTSSGAAAYPLKTNVTLSYWGRLNTNLTNVVQNFGETPFGKELEKRTGVKVNFIHPVGNNQKEVFNLMIASGDLPDIIEYEWTPSGYPGGPEKAIKDKVIIELNETIDKYAPNFKKAVASKKDIDKLVKTDSGKYYVFPMILSENESVNHGPMVRKDWLDELKLPVPQTVDEWYTMLKAFKEKKGATAPLLFQVSSGNPLLSDMFIGAYKVALGYYVDDNGKVHFGPVEPQYKEAVNLLRQWYSEGLIDKDFALADKKAIDAKLLNDKAGAVIYYNSAIATWIDSKKQKDPKFDIVGAPYPTLKKGEVHFSGNFVNKHNFGFSAAITTKCKNVEIAAKWLDYAYGDEGRKFFNYGIEGTSYVTENGKIKFTDLIMKNPQGLELMKVLPQYVRYNGPYVKEDGQKDALVKYSQEAEALKLWSKTEAEKHAFPQVVSYTEEESREVSKIDTELKSYRNEMLIKFIIGAEPMENYSKFVEQLNKIGLEKALKINQDAYDRYLKR